eukprot:767152-Hanusia_phi.AAC.2
MKSMGKDGGRGRLGIAALPGGSTRAARIKSISTRGATSADEENPANFVRTLLTHPINWRAPANEGVQVMTPPSFFHLLPP